MPSNNGGHSKASATRAHPSDLRAEHHGLVWAV